MTTNNERAVKRLKARAHMPYTIPNHRQADLAWPHDSQIGLLADMTMDDSARSYVRDCHRWELELTNQQNMGWRTEWSESTRALLSVLQQAHQHEISSSSQLRLVCRPDLLWFHLTALACRKIVQLHFPHSLEYTCPASFDIEGRQVRPCQAVSKFQSLATLEGSISWISWQ